MVVAIAIVLWLVLKSSSPVYSGQEQVLGLEEKVKVVHDDFGVPHIYSSSEQDAFMALGYLYAQERLFQMDLLRRVGGGGLSEVFGEDLLEVDKLFRILGVNKKAIEDAEANFKEIDKPSEQLALAYLNGINQFIENGSTPPEYLILGLEKEKFYPADLYRIVGYMAFSFALGLKEDPLLNKIYENLGSEYYKDIASHGHGSFVQIPADEPRKTQLDSIKMSFTALIEKIPVPLFLGSNAWVVSPEKSKSGKVLFCNDAHIQYAQPAIWWEAHIECPNFSFYGNHLAGFPFALIGHTQNHAWGLTMFENDDMDFYTEKIEGNMVYHKGALTKLLTRTEEIKVKGQEEPFTLTITETPHGPLMNEVGEHFGESPISMFWTYCHLPNNAIDLAYGLSHSKNMDAFEENLAQHNAPGLNFMYGDVEGNIAWWATAKLPKRPKHVDSKRFLNGATGNDDILGYYPFAENPHSINPKSGFVYSANNQPSTILDSMSIPGYYYAGARGQVISECLGKDEKFDTDDMKELLLDSKGPFHQRNMQTLMKYMSPETEVGNSMKKQMIEWDGSHEKAMVEPTFYYAFQYIFLRNVMQDELGEDDFKSFLQTFVYMKTYHVLAQEDSSVWWDNKSTADVIESKTEIVNQSFNETIAVLTEKFGDTENWKWENVFSVEHSHTLGKVELLAKLFNVGPLPLDGGIEVVNKQSFKLNPDFKYNCTAGPSKRIVIDFADVKNAESILPTGQSGHPLSPHYSDQFTMHVNGEFRPMQMDADKIIDFDRVLFLIP